MMARRGARSMGRAGAHRAGPVQLGETLLHLAARNGHLGLAEKLLAAGVAVDVAAGEVRGPLAGEGVAGGFDVETGVFLDKMMMCFMAGSLLFQV